MGKLQLTGQKLGRVFNSRRGCKCPMHLCCYEAKWANLHLKTLPKELIGYLPLAFALPILTHVGSLYQVRVRSELRAVELSETAILVLEFIFHLLIVRCLFQLRMQHLAHFCQICRKG